MAQFMQNAITSSVESIEDKSKLMLLTAAKTPAYSLVCIALF